MAMQVRVLLHEGRPFAQESPDGKSICICCVIGHILLSVPKHQWVMCPWRLMMQDETFTVKCEGSHPMRYEVYEEEVA